MRYDTLRTTIQSLFWWSCTDSQYTYHKRESASLFQDGFRWIKDAGADYDEDYIDEDSTDSYIIVEGCQDSWDDVLGKNIRLKKVRDIIKKMIAIMDCDCHFNIKNYGNDVKWTDSE